MINNKKILISDVVIDLTSLLDVIFIFLMVVMLNQKETTEDIRSHYGELVVGYQAANDNLTGLADDINNFERIMGILEISMSYNLNNPESRVINVKPLNGDEQIYKLEGNDENTKEEWVRFEGAIIDYIDKVSTSKQDPKNENTDESDDKLKDPKPIIIKINENEERTLYRDQIKMNEIMSELKKEYGNIYLN